MSVKLCYVCREFCVKSRAQRQGEVEGFTFSKAAQLGAQQISDFSGIKDHHSKNRWGEVLSALELQVLSCVSCSD